MNGFYTRRNIIIGYIVSLAILVFFAVITYLNMQKARKENRHVTEALQSIRVLEKILDDILNIETGQRGYIITGKESFLDPYYTALKDLGQDTVALRSLALVNPERKKSYDEIIWLINDKIEFIRATIKIRNEQGYEAATTRIQTEAGRNLMDSIRQLVLEVENESEVYLKRSSNMREEASEFSTLLFTILAIGFLLILLLIFLFINKSLSRQAKYEEELQRFKADLEEEVKLKTKELSNVFDRVSDAVIAFDKNLCYTYLNKRAGEMIRKDPASIIGKKVWDVFPDSVGSATYDAFNRAMAEQKYINNIDYYEPFDLWQENHFYPSPDGLSLFIKDISERKKVEEEFKKSVETRRLIMNSALDAIICIDSQSRITVWTPQAEMVFGWKEDEIIGKKISDTIIPVRYRKSHEKGIAQYMATGEGPLLNKLIEITALGKNGNEFPVELSITPFMQDGTRFFCGFIRDITARKKADEQLSSERNLLRTLIDNLPDYIYVKDNESRYIITNKAFVDLVGAGSESETIGKTVVDFFGAQVGKVNIEEDRAVMEKGEVIIDRDDPIVNLQHENRWLLTTKVPLKDKEGNVIGILGISKDITSRKEAEEQLKNSERKYKLLFESNPMPMWMISMPDRNFVDVNRAAIEQYGYSREEFLKMNAKDIRPKEDVHLLEKLTTEHIPGVNYAGVWRHKKKDDTILKVDVITHDMVYEGRQVRLVLSNDITEKLHAEEKLQKSYEDLRQLASRLQEIREEERAGIAREIHDELGQQLTVLKMDIAWLNKKIGSKDAGIIEKIKQLTEMLDETVKTVRRISSELRPSVLDDLGLVAAMDWHLKEFEKRLGIKTEFIEPEEDPKLDDTTKTALYRILQESLTNVARHSGAGSVKVKLEQNDSDIILTIEDDGKGFDKQKIAEKKTLGILGMKERTSMLGGTYEIISAPEKGTRARIKIPLGM